MSPTLLAMLREFQRGMALCVFPKDDDPRYDSGRVTAYGKPPYHCLTSWFKANLAIERYYASGQAERDGFYAGLGLA